MRLEKPVIGLLQAEPRQVAVEKAQYDAEDALRCPHRQMRSLMREDVGRNAEKMLRQEVIAAAQADEGLVGRLRRVAGNVAARIAGADDERALAPELVHRLVGDGMAHLAGEFARIVRHRGMPVGAVGADERTVALRLAARQRHLPAAVRLQFGALHRCAETDMRAKPIGIGEVAHIAVDLPARRIVGIGVRHREVVVMRLRLRRNEMRRVVDRRSGICPVPQSADIRMPLIDVEGHAVPQQRPRQAQSRRPAADDAHPCRFAHRRAPEKMNNPHICDK